MYGMLLAYAGLPNRNLPALSSVKDILHARPSCRRAIHAFCKKSLHILSPATSLAKIMGQPQAAGRYSMQCKIMLTDWQLAAAVFIGQHLRNSPGPELVFSGF